jgi:uncharacterized membrane protein
MQPRNTPSLAPGVMVHFYRGVMDLSTTWRARIDSTTNWAIVITSSIASFLLSDSGHTHLMALIGMFLAYSFLAIESRRYRFYDLWSGWVRLMETEYYAPILRDNTISPSEQWRALLVSDLQNPHFKVTVNEAMGRRLRHNYFAIFAFLLLVWLVKVTPPADPALGECTALLECARLGPLPGGVIILVIVVFYAYLLALILFTPRMADAGTELLDRQQAFRRIVTPSAELVGFKQHGASPFIVDEAARPPEED